MSLINTVTATPVAEAQNESRPFDIQSSQCPRFVEFLGANAAYNFKLELKELCDRSAQELSTDFYSFAKQDAMATIQTLIQSAVPLSFIINALLIVKADDVVEELKAIPVAPVIAPKEEKSVEEKVLREAVRVVDQIITETPKVLDKVEKETDRVAKQTEKVVKKGKKKLKKAFKKW